MCIVLPSSFLALFDALRKSMVVQDKCLLKVFANPNQQTHMSPRLADSFAGRGSRGPQAFMTDDSDSERRALGRVWPDARCLLCVFHLLRAVWRWLFNRKHGIELAVSDLGLCICFCVSCYSIDILNSSALRRSPGSSEACYLIV